MQRMAAIGWASLQAWGLSSESLNGLVRISWWRWWWRWRWRWGGVGGGASAGARAAGAASFACFLRLPTRSFEIGVSSVLDC